MRVAACIVLVSACAAPAVAPRPKADRIAIIGAERGPRGARIVAIDERGDRAFELLEPAPPSTRVRDQSPSVSPDGRWLAFVSTRGRRLDETSLWIAPLHADAVPMRLGDGVAIDSQPTWTRDGSAIVFASTRARADFDLWRQPMRDGRPAGAAVRLTSAEGHEIEPSVARDGTIVYAAVSRDGTETHIESRAPDGTIARLTTGPADVSPALSPDDHTIAFARPVVHLSTPDSELWRMDRDGSNVSQVIDLRLTDESGPVWSDDGRYLFATSELRGADRRPLFSSIIFIDLRDPTPTARMLEDRAAAIVRFTPAVTRAPLDAEALRSDPEYLSELGRIMARAVEEQRAQP